MIIADHYKDYVGSYVKRFYASFTEDNIHKINGYRRREIDPEFINSQLNLGVKIEHFIDEYLYSYDHEEEWWTDCEDSCIITDELPIKEIAWVANVNDPRYKGYNPYTKQIII